MWAAGVPEVVKMSQDVVPDAGHQLQSKAAPTIFFPTLPPSQYDRGYPLLHVQV